MNVSVGGGEPTFGQMCQQCAVPSALMPHSGAPVLSATNVWPGAGLYRAGVVAM